jgi:hypothetical protein
MGIEIYCKTPRVLINTIAHRLAKFNQIFSIDNDSPLCNNIANGESEIFSPPKSLSHIRGGDAYV